METFGLFQIFHLKNNISGAHSCAYFLFNRWENFSRVYNESIMAMSQIMSVFNYPRMTETSNLSGTTTILFNRNIWELYFSNTNIWYCRFIFIFANYMSIKKISFFKICISLQKCKRLSLFICLLAIVFPCLLIPLYILCTYLLLAISLLLLICSSYFIFSILFIFFINVENIFFLFMDGTLCLSYTYWFLNYVMWHNYINQYLSFTLCSCISYSIREWIESPQNLYVEALTLSVNIFRDGAFTWSKV